MVIKAGKPLVPSSNSLLEIPYVTHLRTHFVDVQAQASVPERKVGRDNYQLLSYGGVLRSGHQGYINVDEVKLGLLSPRAVASSHTLRYLPGHDLWPHSYKCIQAKGWGRQNTAVHSVSRRQ